MKQQQCQLTSQAWPVTLRALGYLVRHVVPHVATTTLHVMLTSELGLLGQVCKFAVCMGV